MKKKALSKMLAVAAFGLVTANTSVDVKAAEEDSKTVAESTSDNRGETTQSESTETASDSSKETTQSESTKSASDSSKETTQSESTESADDTKDNSGQTTQSENTESVKDDSKESTKSESTESGSIEDSSEDTTENESTESGSTEDNSEDTAENESTENSSEDTTEDKSTESSSTEDSSEDTTENESTESGSTEDSSEDTTENESTEDNSEDTAGNESTEDSSEDTIDDVTNGSDNKGPSDFEEAEKNLEKAEQEESAAKDKVDKVQSEVDKAQVDLDNAKQDAEEADKEWNQAKEEKDKAQEEKDNADKAVSDSDEAMKEAESNFEDKLTENNVDKDTFEGIQKDLDEKKADVDKAQQDVDEAQKEYDGKEQEVADAQTKVDEAQKGVDEAQEEKNRADEQVVDANTTVSNAETALEEVKNQTGEDALASAKADLDKNEKELNQIMEQINKGSLGFFEHMAETENDADSTAGKAVEVLTSTEDIRDKKDSNLPSWDEFRSYTKIGSAEDATSLDNMKKAFDFIKECNKLRTEDELRTGCEDLRVTDYLMALAQMNANWAQDSNGKHNSHSKIFNVGENLAWYSAGSDPFDGWYTKEKENYKKDPQWNNDTGHYMNITNSSYATTGFGVCLPNSTTNYGWRCYAQEFAFKGNGKSYTIDEYESRFNAYYDKVTSELAAAQQAYDAAKAIYDKALNDAASMEQLIKNNIAAKQKELDSAKEALGNAQKQAEEKNIALENQKSVKAEADQNLTSAQTALEESYEKLQSAKASLEQVQKVYDEAFSSAEGLLGDDVMSAYKQYTDANNAYYTAVATQEKAAIRLDEAQSALSDATVKKSAADQNLQEKETILANKNVELGTAKKEYALAVANLAIAQDDYNRLKPVSHSSSTISGSSGSSVTYNDNIMINASATGIGRTARFSRNCSFKFFINRLESVIRENSASAMTIDCSDTQWFSISNQVLDTLREKSDQDCTIIFSYKGKKYTFTIPSDFDFSQLRDSDGWYGFMYLNMVFGGHEIV